MGIITREPRATPDVASQRKLQPTALAPLLVASDGTPRSDDAIRAARIIAERTGQHVQVIGVHQPLPTLSPEAGFIEGPVAESESRAAMHVRVLEQLMRVRIEERWPVEVLTGQPAPTIVKVAHRIGASLVVMGLGGHGMYDRVIGDEMVLQVIRLGTVPVLAVAPGFRDLPSRVLAATDFSASSVRGINLCESLIADRGAMTLLHVVSWKSDTTDWKRVNAPYRGAMGRAFDLITANLPRGDIVVHRELAAGDPAECVLEQAKRFNADLVVTGSHGHGFLTRLWLGSVSQKLVRGAQCSVLVAPPADLPSYLEELPHTTMRLESSEWAERLEEFTRRNAGRLGTIEVILPDLGAQVESREMPFRGADFDPRDSSVHLMLGSEAVGGRHLTRSIRDVTAIQVLRDTEGTDLMLRVAHNAGQTLLTLER